jgi:predicted FMN-binding regulatory protein PaiB
MYVAEQFRMPPDDVRRCLETVRYANLVTVDPVQGRPVATLLPWAFAAGPDRFLSHVSRVNDQWRHQATPALLIVDGLHATVEAQWRDGYDEGRAAPGTDYEAVHVWGRLTADDSLAANLDSWDRLMAAHGSGVTVADMDPEWLAQKAKASVAITLTVTDVLGKSKLSQAQSPEEIRRIADRMAATCPALAARLIEVAVPYAESRAAAVDRARQRR